MCCQLEEDDDLEDEVENMKKAFTVSDTLVTGVSSSDLQLDSLQRLQHQPKTAGPDTGLNGHSREMMALGLQRAGHDTEEERGREGYQYHCEAGKMGEPERRHEASRRNERLRARERGEDITDSVKKRRSQSYSKHVDGRRSMEVSR